MERLGYDTITIDSIPPNPYWVAGYTSGRWPTYLPLAKAFPNAKHISINIHGDLDGQALDCEQGDVSPTDFQTIVNWAKRQIGRGVKPRIYASVSVMQPIVDALLKSGLKRTDFFVWTAHYTLVPHRCTQLCGFGFKASADCTQYTDRALGRNLDASLCIDEFLHDPPKPHGKATFAGSFDVASKAWEVHGTPNPGVVLDPNENRWASALLRQRHGVWEVIPLPWDFQPPA